MTIPVFLKRERSGAWLLMLWIQPGAKKSGFAGLYGERLKLKLSAAPVEGAANDELTRFLAAALNIPTNRFRLIAGHSGRAKTVRVSDIPDETLLDRLSDIV